MTRAKRRPCQVCGGSERECLAGPKQWHPGSGTNQATRSHPYTPTPPILSGVHRTPRLDMKVPDPDGRADRWRAVAEREGVSLGELVRRALEAYCFAAEGLLEPADH